MGAEMATAVVTQRPAPRRLLAAALAICLLFGLGACSAPEPPGCDGGPRRPVNSGAWSVEE